MIVDALDASTGDLQALAEEIGVSYDTLWAWKAGRRMPSPENRRRLAEAMERRSARLAELADRLRKSADG